MIKKILVDYDNNVSILQIDNIDNLNEEHKKTIKKIIDIDDDTTNGVCSDDMSSQHIDCWIYDSNNEKIVIDKNKLIVKHLYSFRLIREKILSKLDYMLIDATALKDDSEIQRLIDIKKFLKDYPDMIIKNSDKYTIDYFKTLPSELFI